MFADFSSVETRYYSSLSLPYSFQFEDKNIPLNKPTETVDELFARFQKTVKDSYQCTTEGIKPAEAVKVDEALKLITPKQIEKVKHAATKKWKPHGVLINPYAILAAFKEKAIDSNTCGTLLNFWLAYSFYKEKLIVVSIFDDINCIKVNQFAEYILKYASLSGPQEKQLLASPVMLQRHWEDFIKIMSNSPKVQQQFLAVTDDQEDPELYPKGTISLKISGQLQENDLGRFSLPNTPQNGRMIPSLGMYQAFLTAVHKDNAPTLVFVIGELPNEKLTEYLVKQQWPVCGALPDVPNPETADGHLAPHVDFAHHDARYHAHLIAATPRPQQKLFIGIAHHLKQLGLCDSELGDHIYALLVSMDHPDYSPINNPTHSGISRLFWRALAKDLMFNVIVKDESEINISAERLETIKASFHYVRNAIANESKLKRKERTGVTFEGLELEYQQTHDELIKIWNTSLTLAKRVTALDTKKEDPARINNIVKQFELTVEQTKRLAKTFGALQLFMQHLEAHRKETKVSFLDRLRNRAISPASSTDSESTTTSED